MSVSQNSLKFQGTIHGMMMEIRDCGKTSGSYAYGIRDHGKTTKSKENHMAGNIYNNYQSRLLVTFW